VSILYSQIRANIENNSGCAPIFLWDESEKIRFFSQKKFKCERKILKWKKKDIGYFKKAIAYYDLVSKFIGIETFFSNSVISL